MSRRVAALLLLFCLGRCAHRQESRAAGEGERVHVVEKGDTTSAIARRYGVSIEELVERNGLGDPDQIRAGEALVIPRSEGGEPNHPPQPDTASLYAPAPAPDRRELPSSPDSGAGPFVWPVDGVVISGFGSREGTRHDGIDIAAVEGTPIWASASGTVVYEGEQPGLGKLVILAHDGGLVSIYAHNLRNLVSEGAAVQQGQPIAEVGRSGGASSPAVHFEIREGRTPLNPLTKLP